MLKPDPIPCPVCKFPMTHIGPWDNKQPDGSYELVRLWYCLVCDEDYETPESWEALAATQEREGWSDG